MGGTGDNLSSSEFGPQKVPCVSLLSFSLLTAQEQREDYSREGEMETWWTGGPIIAHKPSELNGIPMCG